MDTSQTRSTGHLELLRRIPTEEVTGTSNAQAPSPQATVIIISNSKTPTNGPVTVESFSRLTAAQQAEIAEMRKSMAE
jgi:hypothetical protein